MHYCRAIEMNFRHVKYLNQTAYFYLKGRKGGKSGNKIRLQRSYRKRENFLPVGFVS